MELSSADEMPPAHGGVMLVFRAEVVIFKLTDSKQTFLSVPERYSLLIKKLFVLSPKLGLSCNKDDLYFQRKLVLLSKYRLLERLNLNEYLPT